MKNKIKILVVGHKDFPVIKNEIYLPIQAGRKIAEKKLPKPWIGDDTGENISDKNKEYCELTAMYWAWKNYDKLGNPEYIGLCNYRRYFTTQEICTKKSLLFYLKKIADRSGLYFSFRRIYRKFIKKNASQKGQETMFFKFEQNHTGEIETLTREIMENDIILPKRHIAPNPPIRNHYFKYGDVHKNDFINMEKLIKEKFPEDYESFKKVANSKSIYLCNMFIMRKKLFEDYSVWLFEKLFHLEKILELTEREGYNRRALGLLSEILFNVWIENRRNGKKVKELDVVSFT